MRIGLLGKKLGMTQMFTEEGRFVPVTAIEVGPCTVLRVSEGKALIGFGARKEKNVPKQELGFYKKVNTKPSAFVKEIAFDADIELSAGQQLTVDILKENTFVDITGTSKGKGFQGGVKRWGWAGGPDSHGSMHHRRIGSVGGSSFPSRLWKGLHMPGRMGNERKTTQNLEIVKIYKESNMLLVKGAVPGANNGYLEINSSKKKQGFAKEKQEQAKKETPGKVSKQEKK